MFRVRLVNAVSLPSSSSSCCVDNFEFCRVPYWRLQRSPFRFCVFYKRDCECGGRCWCCSSFFTSLLWEPRAGSCGWGFWCKCLGSHQNPDVRGNVCGYDVCKVIWRVWLSAWLEWGPSSSMRGDVSYDVFTVFAMMTEWHFQRGVVSLRLYKHVKKKDFEFLLRLYSGT